jgi:hypothetical protein
VSVSPGYRASFADAKAALGNIMSRTQARMVAADISAGKLPELTSHADVTDAYLV